jgi:hypothetical protein
VASCGAARPTVEVLPYAIDRVPRRACRRTLPSSISERGAGRERSIKGTQPMGVYGSCMSRFRTSTRALNTPGLGSLQLSHISGERRVQPRFATFQVAHDARAAYWGLVIWGENIPCAVDAITCSGWEGYRTIIGLRDPGYVSRSCGGRRSTKVAHYVGRSSMG